MSKYRVIALDLDGTLLNKNGEVSEENARWIGKAAEAGVKVIFSTGRGIHNAEWAWKELGLDSPMVFLNGAEIWKNREEVCERHFIPEEDKHKLHRLAVEHQLWYRAFSVERMLDRPEWDPGMLKQAWQKFVMKPTSAAQKEQIRRTILQWGTLEVTGAGPLHMEMTLKGVTKETGVRRVCSLVDIGMDQVLAMGDGPNDVPLLQAAGLGVAMGNAMEEVIRAADVMTDTNQNDGVAKAIQKYVFGCHWN